MKKEPLFFRGDYAPMKGATTMRAGRTTEPVKVMIFPNMILSFFL